MDFLLERDRLESRLISIGDGYEKVSSFPRNENERFPLGEARNSKQSGAKKNVAQVGDKLDGEAREERGRRQIDERNQRCNFRRFDETAENTGETNVCRGNCDI